jgi:leucyl aminopeptidase
LNHALQDLYYEQDSEVMNKVGTVTPVLRAIQPKTISSNNNNNNNNTNTNKKRYALLSLGPSWLREQYETTASSKQQQHQSPPPAIGYTIGKAIATICCTEKKVTVATIHLPDSIIDNAIILRNITTAFYTELYRDNRYKTNDNKHMIHCTTVYIRCEDSTVQQSIINIGYHIAQGIYMTKDIVNAPHNVLNSMSLAETAQRIASLSINGRIKCNILNKQQCEEYGMGAYLGVARGSETVPQFIHLTYTSPSSSSSSAKHTGSATTAIPRKRIAFVGKGLLFDTGGYNIKTQMMELMKFDCGGAAAVLGAAYTLGQIDQDQIPYNVEVHFIVAACENMINEKAIVPSDILIASNGKTIEVLNTDAEGRLTLADALVYADVQCKCETIIELSTLTGACMVALGKGLCGLWTHDDILANELYDISKITTDKVWRMPMVTEYEEQIKSKIADLQNLGSSKYGGSITAALFLQHFVTSTKSFAHLDIAGPVWDDTIGATGFGTKLILEYISRQGMQQ